MKKILFICTGNTCRSSMAEGLFKKLLTEYGIDNIEASSAGTSVFFPSCASDHAIKIMRDQGIDLSTHQSKQVTKEMVEKANLIFTMTVNHRENVIRLCPQAADRVFTLKEFANEAENNNALDIGDPFGLPEEYYEECAREIYSFLEKMLEKLMRDYEEWKLK
ncbi:MAG: low molecular weight protein arginine phosphatase [Firmicutes bacterium]|nr:low molecular weight protein arginine phosphatase [Bacillota bacterium]